jgi:hypothetical protein
MSYIAYQLVGDPPQLLPHSIPIATAARIAGLSPATFKARCIATSAVMVRDGRVVLASLERHLGRSITADEYLKADRARDRARTYQARYRRKRT